MNEELKTQHRNQYMHTTYILIISQDGRPHATEAWAVFTGTTGYTDRTKILLLLYRQTNTVHGCTSWEKRYEWKNI